MARLEWFGPTITSELDTAIETAMVHVMLDCIAYTQQAPSLGGAPVVTGWLSMHITWEHPTNDGGRIIGRWGNLNEPSYAAQVHMRNPYLQRAADELHPTLGERIAENMP